LVNVKLLVSRIQNSESRIHNEKAAIGFFFWIPAPGFCFFAFLIFNLSFLFLHFSF